MTEAPRVSPRYVRERMQSGADTLLVCAYDDPEKCRSVGLEGSIDFGTFAQKLPSIAKDREIVFFCA